jgi:hypothetical protein
MIFWLEMMAAVLGYMCAGSLLLLSYFAFRWFIQATDVIGACTWAREGDRCHPIFEFRNRSKSGTFLLAEVTYSSAAGGFAWFDSNSLMGKELRPQTVNDFWKIAPVRCGNSIPECLRLQVTVRLQTGRALWIENQPSAQRATDKLQRAALSLRDFIEK